MLKKMLLAITCLMSLALSAQTADEILEKVKNIYTGVDMVRGQLISCLEANGLKKIEVDLGRIQFDYKEDIQLSIRKENINPEDKAAFDQTLRKCLSKKNIYYSDSYSKYVEKV